MIGLDNVFAHSQQKARHSANPSRGWKWLLGYLCFAYVQTHFEHLARRCKPAFTRILQCRFWLLAEVLQVFLQ